MTSTGLGVSPDPWGLSALLYVDRQALSWSSAPIGVLNGRVIGSELRPLRQVLLRMWGVAGALVGGQVVGFLLSP